MKANMAYIVDAGLARGVVGRYADGRLRVHVGRILPKGVNIVEGITSRSVDRLEDPAAGEIRGAPDEQRAFWERCVNVAAVCKVAVEVAGQVFAAIGQ